MKNSKKRQEDQAVDTYFETLKLHSKLNRIYREMQKEDEKEEELKYQKRVFAFWKVVLVWLLKLTSGGGTV